MDKEKFYNEEIPLWVKQCYNELSLVYTYKYEAKSSVKTKNRDVDLFTYLEDFISKHSFIDYDIRRHFDFHSAALFYTASDDFGFTRSSKYLNEYDFPLFDKVFYSSEIKSSIIKKKLRAISN